MKAPRITKSDYINLSKKLGIIRIAFGLVWLVDAVLKFEPSFYRNLLTTIKATDSGEPGWLNPWYHFWYKFIGIDPHLFAVIVIILESGLAICLLLGLMRRAAYIVGAVLSFIIWGVGEAFGGPYVSGSTDIGAGIIYVLVFIMLYFTEQAIEPSLTLTNLINNYRNKKA